MTCQPTPDGVCERLDCPRCGEANPAEIHTCSPAAVIRDPHLFATQIAFTMRLADAPLSEQQFVTLCAYLTTKSQPDD